MRPVPRDVYDEVCSQRDAWKEIAMNRGEEVDYLCRQLDAARAAGRAADG